MKRHENCLLCDIGWARDHQLEPRDMPSYKRGTWSTEAEDIVWPHLVKAEDKYHYPSDIPSSLWDAYMEATLDMAYESVWGGGGE